MVERITLRERMRRVLRIRNDSPRTEQAYLRAVAQFAAHWVNLPISSAPPRSSRMLLHISGKGRKDRYVPLSPIVLELLRDWWRSTRPHDLLFPNQKDPSRALSRTTVQRVVRYVWMTWPIRRRLPSGSTTANSRRPHGLFSKVSIRGIPVRGNWLDENER